MRSLYLECYSGISGDMTVAALLDLGADQKVLEKALASLPVHGFQTEVTRVKKSALDACDFLVKLDAEHENHDHDMNYLYGHDHSEEHGHHPHEHLHEQEEHHGHGHTHHHDHDEDHSHAHPHEHDCDQDHHDQEHHCRQCIHGRIDSFSYFTVNLGGQSVNTRPFCKMCDDKVI